MLEEGISFTVTTNNGKRSNSSNSRCESDEGEGDLCDYYYYYHHHHHHQEINVLF
jgi:hypothetical protein